MAARQAAVVRSAPHCAECLGRDDHRRSFIAKRFAENFLRTAARIDVGGVEQVDAGIDTAVGLAARAIDVSDTKARRRSVAEGHRAKAQHRKLEPRSEEHTSELQSLMRISYAVFCLKKKKKQHTSIQYTNTNRKIEK